MKDPNTNSAAFLDYILLFLADKDVATACQVCRAWHDNIWPRSSVWRQLLQRRNWPLPSTGQQEQDASTTATDSTSNPFRLEFLQHYNLMRKLQNLAAVADQTTEDERSAKVRGLHLISADPPVALVASQAEYTGDLSIFRKSPQQYSLCADFARMPEGSGYSGVYGTALDEKWVACLYFYQGFGELQDENKLAIWSWPQCETQQELFVLDVNASLRSRLAGSGISMDWGLVQLSESIASCGNGRFLLEAAVFIGDEDTDYEEQTPVARKLVMFSTEGIVWIGDSSLPGMDPLLYHQKVVLSSGFWDEEVRLIAASDQGIRLGTVALPGAISTDALVSGWAPLPLPQVPNDSWKLWPGGSSIAICERQAIVAFQCEFLDEHSCEYKVLLCFYSFSADNVCELVQTIDMVAPDGAAAFYPIQVAPLGNKHVLVVTQACIPVAASGGGHWQRSTILSQRITAHLFDRESHCEICHFGLMTNNDHRPDTFIAVAPGETTIALASNGGIFMSS